MKPDVPSEDTVYIILRSSQSQRLQRQLTIMLEPKEAHQALHLLGEQGEHEVEEAIA